MHHYEIHISVCHIPNLVFLASSCFKHIKPDLVHVLVETTLDNFGLI